MAQKCITIEIFLLIAMAVSQPVLPMKFSISVINSLLFKRRSSVNRRRIHKCCFKKMSFGLGDRTKMKNSSLPTRLRTQELTGNYWDSFKTLFHTQYKHVKY